MVTIATNANNLPGGQTAATDAVTTVGAPQSGTYGAEIHPLGPVQDMWTIDTIAGIFPPNDKGASPAVFTGGTGGAGLGGVAEPLYPDGESTSPVLPHTVYERRGY